MRRLACVLWICVLGGCAGLPVDTTYTSVGQDSRVQYLVLHFTSSDFPSALKILPTDR